MLTSQRIEEVITGVDHYLQKLHGFSEEIKAVKATMEAMRHSREEQYLWELQKLNAEMRAIRTELEKRGLPEISEYEVAFRELKELVHSDEWPRAVDPRSIIITEDAAFHRAHQILDLIIGEPLTGKSFLDFGCGGGHVVMAALEQNPKFAMGYDINAGKIKFDNEHFTSELDVVGLKGPYDIVLLQDVLDHIEYVDPVAALKQVKRVVADGGRVFVRNHPWCSRHGSHLYTKLNKAFAHLVLDEAELCRMGGYINDHTLKIYYPMETYRKWFSDAGFRICSEIKFPGRTEDYFRKPSFSKERLVKHWGGDETQMILNTQIDFVEYVLEPISDEATI
jgi:2-polyprenyl-3-methyl-5-hydroxy-6-metoxy-1,4-benzoquinol methylase